jgi:phosphonate transport system substrate-binding protein
MRLSQKIQKITSLASGAFILLAACQTDQTAEMTGADGVCPATLRFADTGTEGLEELRRDFAEFQATMEEILGVNIEFFAVSDRTAAAAGIQADQLDMVLAGPSEYIAIKANAGLEPVIAIERPGYRSFIMVKTDSDIQDIEDLKGRTIAMKDPGSTSGHIGPIALLMDEGIDPENDVDLRLLGDLRIEAFAAGDVDALGSGTSDERRVEEAYGEDFYRLIAEGPELPRDVIGTNPNIPAECNEEIQRRILENEDRVLDALLASSPKYGESSLHPANDEDYEQMREVHRSVGIDYGGL